MLESHMMSVMRVREMTDLDESDDSESTSPELMPKELSVAGDALSLQFTESASRLLPSPKHEKALIAAGWPWKGGVRFQNVSMRYNSAAPLVLKNLSIDVPPGSTLGSFLSLLSCSSCAFLICCRSCRAHRFWEE